VIQFETWSATQGKSYISWSLC